ncbi:hypothetical protein [Streptomyces sp. NBC_00391]|uniref:hypothetical protein n=1 Tax=Streptomyces sp. NBC_00391 TaxID=2903647 RepID=UPI002E248EEA
MGDRAGLGPAGRAGGRAGGRILPRQGRRRARAVPPRCGLGPRRDVHQLDALSTADHLPAARHGVDGPGPVKAGVVARAGDE